MATAAVVAAGCGAPESSSLPAAPPGSWPLATFLDSVDFHLREVDADGRALVDAIGVEGARVVRVGSDGAVEPVAPGHAPSHRFVAKLADDRVVIETATSAAAPPALALVDAGVVRPLGTSEGHERLLGVSGDGRLLYLVRVGESGEDLFEARLPGLARRGLATLPAGFRAAAISSDGFRLALVRAVHDEADEVIVLDRRVDERRLVLPTEAEGRFKPFGFAADGSTLWFESDDASDLPRLERLDLAGGGREAVLDRACVDSLPVGGALPTTLESGCDGRRIARSLGPPPRWHDLTLPASLGVGARIVQAWPAGPDTDWLAFAGGAATREVAWLSADRLPAPATRGLAPRLDAARLPAPTAVDLGLGGVAAELWAPARAAIGGVVWLLPLERRPDLGRFAPFAAFLASRGVATLLVVPRGAPGTGRAARAATDGDPAGATASEALRALSVLRGRGVAGVPVALVGEGGWCGAIAAEVASRPGSGFAAAVALDPDSDPLAALDRVAAAGEPMRSRGITRWGDPGEARVVERRRELAAAATRPTIPLLVVVDSALGETAVRLETLEAARAAGAPLRAIARVRPAFASGAGRRALEETWRHLRERFAPPPATP